MKQIFLDELEKIENKISFYLSENYSEEWKKDSFGQVSESVNKNHILQLVNPVLELVKLGGKRWRPLLLVLCAKAVDEKNELCYELAPLVEFVHTASLVHDDIEDCSQERRGKPCAYLTYGTDVAINAGSWLYFQASLCIQTLKIDDTFKCLLYKTYLQELRKLHLGQAMDIYWHSHPEIFPSADEYIAMVQNKTGTLASLAAKTGFLCGIKKAGSEDRIGKAAQKIGAGFQIIDDVINLTTGNAGKNRGDDIVEGKKSLPVLIYASRNKTENLQNLFIQARKEGIKSQAVENAIKLLEKDGAIIEAKKQGIDYINEGCKEFREILGNSLYTELIEELFTSMIPQL